MSGGVSECEYIGDLRRQVGSKDLLQEYRLPSLLRVNGQD